MEVEAQCTEDSVNPAIQSLQHVKGVVGDERHSWHFARSAPLVSLRLSRASSGSLHSLPGLRDKDGGVALHPFKCFPLQGFGMQFGCTGVHCGLTL